jgi:hypothetical protein
LIRRGICLPAAAAAALALACLIARVMGVMDSDGVGALVAIDRIGSAVRMPGWNGMGWDGVYWACLIVIEIVVQIADATG